MATNGVAHIKVIPDLTDFSDDMLDQLTDLIEERIQKREQKRMFASKMRAVQKPFDFQ